MRMETASPRSAVARSSAVSISLSSPRRRWLGTTLTLVRADAATWRGPGTVSSVGKVRSVATTPASSKAPQVRARSTSSDHQAAKAGSKGRKKAVPVQASHAPISSSSTVRTSALTGSPYRPSGAPAGAGQLSLLLGQAGAERVVAAVLFLGQGLPGAQLEGADASALPGA